MSPLGTMGCCVTHMHPMNITYPLAIKINLHKYKAYIYIDEPFTSYQVKLYIKKTKKNTVFFFFHVTAYARILETSLVGEFIAAKLSIP